MSNVPETGSPSTAPDGALIASLLGDALTLLDRDRPSARRRIEQACSLVLPVATLTPDRGGLAPWQARRVEAHIRAHLGGSLRIEDVAAVAKLSASYFSRAFKATFGIAFSGYVMQRRIDQAKHMLLTSDRPICDIALACGLADQSHLTRLFSRTVGMPPHAWRRYMRYVPTGAAA